ncbi:MAG TPA: APC family permease, partial [Microthrixaceae bacterium]|nr:APC family permease [Microthrixaceae bacterium]
LIGRPISSDEADHQRLSKRTGLAVFSSDAISSTAYATGEVMLVLVGVGGMAAATSHLIPVAVLVVILLALVANSYRETIHAYPSGGGSYIVSRENLGEMPSLVAGASLLIDYVLTVAVSIAAGTLAITSAFHELRPYRLWICLGFLALLTIGNLRGIKESGRLFALPTYVYIFMLSLFIGYAIYRQMGGTLPVLSAPDALPRGQVLEHFGPYAGGVSMFIFARAFASGAVALSGVEAISNGVPAFHRPEPRNAALTLGAMALILGSGFFGISYVAVQMRPMPSEQESIISIMGRALFGGDNPIYFVLQIATFAILVLAANTAFADFPRLAAIIGKDGYLPRQFGNRGDRLVFSNGILILSGLAAGLLILFRADVTLLIPLYAVGVFTSFTLSQIGMVRHHLNLREPHWPVNLAGSALGGMATLVVAIVVVVSKFLIGAWIIVLAIPIVVAAFKAVKRHYNLVGRQLHIDPQPEEPPLTQQVVVLVGSVNRSAIYALQYARSLGTSHVTAISAAIDENHTEQLREQWNQFQMSVPLDILESPYRDLTNTVIAFLDEFEREHPGDILTVIIPEAVVPRWWQGILHNQSALALKVRLLRRRNTVVISIPFHLGEATPSAPEALTSSSHAEGIAEALPTEVEEASASPVT